MERGGYVYILTNFTHTTLYTGVTSNLRSRIYEHRNSVYPSSFSARYKTFKLVYYESHLSIEEAIVREKQLKAGPRRKKVELINRFNKNWVDLFSSIPE